MQQLSSQQSAGSGAPARQARPAGSAAAWHVGSSSQATGRTCISRTGSGFLPLSLQGSPQPSLSIASYFPMTKELPLKKNHLTQAPNLLALSFLSSSQLTVSTCGFHALTSHSSLSPFQIGFCPTIRQKQLLPRSPWPPPTSLNHTGVFAAIPELSAAAMHFCSRLLPHALPPPYSTTPDASGFSPFLWSLLWTPVQGHCS